MYETEVQAVDELAIDRYLINFEALAGMSDAEKAARRVPMHHEITEAIFRGWMLKPEQYAALYEALLRRGVRLINDPAAYRHCHYLPESYSVIEEYTPQSVWIEYNPEVSADQIMAVLKPFGNAPVIVKDYVKSQKHYWNEACFIPDASDQGTVMHAVQRFLDLQGDDLNKGLVFRRFIEFEPLAVHAQSAMPLTKEYRIFFLHGKPVYSVAYWEEGDYGDPVPPTEQFVQVAQQVRSHFFSMDVARRLDGEWMIVELGDGQVSGLPARANTKDFYSSLANTNA